MVKRALKILGLIICLPVAAMFFQTGHHEAYHPAKNEPQSTEALQVQAITVVPRLATYGQAKSSRVWAAVARADSRLMWISPKVISGGSVEKGEELLRLIGENLIAAGQKEAEVNIILAPFSGVITTSELETGKQVASGTTLLTLDATDNAEITIGLNNEKLAMLSNASINQPEKELASEIQGSLAQAWVEVAVEGGKDRLPARLGSKPVSINTGTGLMEASLTVDKPLYLGAMHQVFICAPPKEGQVVIPRQAVHGDEVFVVDDKKRLKKRQVTVKYSLDNYVIIGQGLKPGETLVIGDVASLKTGDLTDVRLNDQFYLTAKSELGNIRNDRRRSTGEFAG